MATCAHKLGIHDIAQVHTSDQFWVLQTAELGLFIALTALTAAVCFWWLIHRTD